MMWILGQVVALGVVGLSVPIPPAPGEMRAGEELRSSLQDEPEQLVGRAQQFLENVRYEQAEGTR